MSDVFSSLCSFGRSKKKNSVVNSVTVVGVKKALLLGKIESEHKQQRMLLLVSGFLSNKEDRKGLDESLDTDMGEVEQAMNKLSCSTSDRKHPKAATDLSSTRSVSTMLLTRLTFPSALGTLSTCQLVIGDVSTCFQ